MIGERLREARQSQGRSLADIASKVKISVATLSRIETDKQSVDLDLFLSLARVLNVPAHEFLDGSDAGAGQNGDVDPLARRIAALSASDRAELWRELAAVRRARRVQKDGNDMRYMAQQVDELLAQVHFLREELEAVRKRVKKR